MIDKKNILKKYNIRADQETGKHFTEKPVECSYTGRTLTENIVVVAIKGEIVGITDISVLIYVMEGEFSKDKTLEYVESLPVRYTGKQGVGKAKKGKKA